MSRIVRHTNTGNPLSHYIQTESGNMYYVDSRYTFDVGFETMVFLCNSKVKVPRKNWNTPVYEKKYATYQDMEKHHRELVEDAEVYLKGA